MKRFEHTSATSVQDAVRLLSVQNARVLAGGTDLVMLMKEGLLATERVVDLKAIPGLDRIQQDRGEIQVGAMARLADVAASGLLIEKAPALAQAAAAVATPQLRNMGTLGGNVAQKVRCWYYRDADRADCYKRNGSYCYAIFGQSDLHAIFDGAACFAVSPSDTGVALTALDAKMVIAGPEGHRIVPADGFFVGPDTDYLRETVLAQNEVLTEVRIAESDLATKSVFLKAAQRKSIDFARASVGVAIAGGPVVQRARIVLGGVAPTPHHATLAEEYVTGKRLDADVIAKAAALAVEGAKPLRSNAYKIQLAQGLVRKALTRLAA
ncbi:MAG TPA: FAD binding domain-containing protein [Candidatus Limnocylindria bacterium]|nr:FAD binding domain-containing protein [Candidatus Limnocylindria bacterium]